MLPTRSASVSGRPASIAIVEQGDEVYHYLLAHWQGKQSLAWSFWVNLVVLRLLLFAGQKVAGPDEFEDYSDHGWAVITLVVIVHGVIFVWQVVGTWRATEHHLRTSRAQSIVWGIQAALLLCFWLTLVHAWGGWQMAQSRPLDEAMNENSGQQGRDHVEIAIVEETGDIVISGPIGSGMTQRTRQVIDANPALTRVVLNSPGGDLYEGRGLAKLFRQRGLATHVEIACASACTSAYIGGSPRTLAREARLGFHQYRVDADYHIIVTSVEAEQARDQKLFIAAGVNARFVEKMFERSASDMWWPDIGELLQAGVVDRVL